MLSQEQIASVDTHWAVSALPRADLTTARRLAIEDVVLTRIGQRLGVGQQERSDQLLLRVATAYELAAIEGLEALLFPSDSDENRARRVQAQAGAYRAFEFMRSVSCPTGEKARIFHVLHLSGLAYCADRWTDARRWLRENERKTRVPSIRRKRWDTRILYRLYDAWVRLLRKNSWEDLQATTELIVMLREEQAIYEAEFLKKHSGARKRASSLRLVGLYHWAKATESLATFMLQGSPDNVLVEIDQQFEAAIRSASASHDVKHEIVLRWLHVVSRQMIAAVNNAILDRGVEIQQDLDRQGLNKLRRPR